MNYLDMWYRADFCVDGKKFWSVGQYMVHAHAILLGEGDIAGRVCECTERSEVAELDRLLPNTTSWLLRYTMNLREGIESKLWCNESLMRKFLGEDDIDSVVDASDNDDVGKAVIMEVYRSLVIKGGI